MSWDHYTRTPEAQAKRLERATLQKAQQPDPLIERARLYELGRESARYWPGFNTRAPIRDVYRNPAMRRHAALPGLRHYLQDRIDSRKAAERAARQQAAEQRAHAAAMAKAPPLPLFDQLEAA